MSENIEWKDQFSVGILELDAHHHGLIDLINSLNNPEYLQSPDKEKVLKLLFNLKRYTEFHFSKEENYMQEYNYPGFDEHLKEHKLFIRELERFEAAVNDNMDETAGQIASFLRNWFIKHILTIDRQYSEYFKKMGIDVS